LSKALALHTSAATDDYLDQMAAVREKLATGLPG
jgi:hypothetical protein